MAGTGDGVRLDGGVSEGLPMRRDSAQGHAVVIGQDPLPPVAQLGPLHSASPASDLSPDGRAATHDG